MNKDDYAVIRVGGITKASITSMTAGTFVNFEGFVESLLNPISSCGDIPTDASDDNMGYILGDDLTPFFPMLPDKSLPARVGEYGVLEATFKVGTDLAAGDYIEVTFT